MPKIEWAPYPGLARRRLERGLSQEAAARAIPVTVKTWRRWEQSERIPVSAIPAVEQLLPEYTFRYGRSEATPRDQSVQAAINARWVRMMEIFERTAAEESMTSRLLSRHLAPRR